MNKKLKKCLLSTFVVLVLTISFSRVRGISSLPDMATDFASDEETSDVWSRSNITMQASQNLTVVPSNHSLVELSSEINPTRSVMDVVRGFEPTRRFDSEFNSTLVDETRVGVCSLTRVDNELLLFLNASSEMIAIARYNLSFTNPKQISANHSVSVAFSTTSDYDSSEAYIGVSLLLRDQEGNRYYVSLQVSNHAPTDSYTLSKWFLGHTVDLTKECLEYPHYRMRYDSTSGPWFVQLPLSDSFASLGLSSAWLDGLFIGGETYSRTPLDPEEITEVNATFHYVLVHGQPFTINQEIVNSTMMAFPFAGSLRFSGIPAERVNVVLEGSLKPSYDKDEQRENETVRVREAFFNLSETSEGEISVQRIVEITVFSKTVKKCTVTLDNNTIVDLTDSLLGANAIIYSFPANTTLLKVHLTLYRFNAWLFSLSGFQPSKITKKGIVEEHFSPNENEGTINLNSSETSPDSLAISSGNLTPSEITINGSEKPLESLLILDEEMHWVIPIGTSEENVSTYAVKYILSDEPLYQSLTTNPFSVYIHGSVFEIFTPFNIEGQEGTPIPLTIRTYTTPRTYTIKIEYDSSMFEADRNEKMVYASRPYFVYFMLKPLRTGQTTVNVRIIDPVTRDTLFSSPFYVTVKSRVFTQVAIYSLLGITIFSLIHIFTKKSLLKRISRFRH